MTKLYLIAGRTGAGKSTIARRIERLYGIPQVKSYATRPMRQGEEEHADHIFIRPEEVEKYKADMSAYTKIGEYEYFTTWSLLAAEPAYLYVIDPVGINDIKKAIKESSREDDFETRVIYITIDHDERLARLVDRGDDEGVAAKRMADEDAQFTAFEESISHDRSIYVIENSDLDAAVKCIYNDVLK